MRKLMIFTIGFAAACGLGALLLPEAVPLWLGFFLLAGGLLLLVPENRALKISGILLMGFGVGLSWFAGYQLWKLEPAKGYDGLYKELTIEVTKFRTDSSDGNSVYGCTELDGAQWDLVTYVYGDAALSPGDLLKGEFLLVASTGRDGAGDYYASNGIQLIAYPKGKLVHEPVEAVPQRYFPQVLRKNALDLMERLFPEDTRGFAQALLLGKTGSLTNAQNQDLRQSGISHVVAVSGLHVSILFSMIYGLCFRRRLLTALLGFPALLIFGAVAGFSPSVVRACTMQALMLLSILINREYDTPTALAFSVLVLLGINPLCIRSVSFQLSVGAVMGIQLFSRRLHDYLLSEKRLGPAKGKGIRARLIRWLVSGVSVTIGALIVTVPLTAWHFSSISLVSVLTNLLVLSVTTWAFYGILAAGILGLLFWPLGVAVAQCTSWLIRYILVAAAFCADLPLAQVSTKDPYILVWTVFTYGLLLILLLSKKKHPWVVGAMITAGLAAAVAFSAFARSRLDYRLTVLDVGQGQCILYFSGDDAYMVDCGGNPAAPTRAIEELRLQGVDRLTGLVVTHMDGDHTSGIPEFLELMEVDTVYLPYTQQEEARELLTAIDSEIYWVYRNTQLHCGKGSVTIFPGEAGTSDNESSLCVLFQTEKCDILIMADRDLAGEAYLLKTADLPDLDILVVGHHGAEDSTGPDLLRKTAPEIAVISVGRNNRFGHPDQPLLDRLELYGCQILRTDQDGTCTFGR